MEHMRENLVKIFIKLFKKDPYKISYKKNEIEAWDSIGHINLIIEIEESFDISFTPDEIDEIIDFESALRIVELKNKY